MRSWLDFHEASLGEGEVSLGAVFNEICELISQHEPKWPREWKRALDDALDKLLAGPLDQETLEGWHLQQKATLFLRLEMEEERLQVYVRDPVTEKVLCLRCEDWMRFSPKEYIPVGGHDNFILDGNYGVIGADGTRFYAHLASAFVSRQEIRILINKRLIRSHNDAPQGALVRQSVLALWNGDPPLRLAAKTRNFEIQEWVRKNHNVTPSIATIKRELREMRLERQRPKSDR
ncbi:hypothetical protein [Bradyrhizobium sp. SZCCHNRI3043]|uniref:hypothetical protein n=1 Tax=Bradyrhizobium sp. SZCCHNRI3043 TaxID=3057292 RepID=UPI0028E428F7|nr:hypothetical protein [Bradyrhizobium sp. SZCCHNRI3043]